MRIAIDSNIFTMQKFGGVTRYLVRLSEELVRMGNEVEVHGWLHTNRHLRDSVADLTRMRYIERFPRYTRRLAHHAGDWLACGSINRQGPDMIHESFCHSRRVGPPGVPRVCTVHDMIHELYPEYWGAMDRTPEYRKATIERCRAVICVSMSTRRDLLRLLDLDPSKVHVIHHGFEPFGNTSDLTPIETERLATATKKPFLLYVGARNSYKNFTGLLQAVAESNLNREVGIIAFGGGPLGYPEQELISSLGFKHDEVRQLSGSDSLLSALFREAQAFVYPSLYEGFGFPPLEAMAEGCPVVSSHSSSMPEIIGTAAEFFDPNDPISIASAIRTVLTDAKRRAELIDLGKQRLPHFSWHDCARKTLEVYQSVA
jgi:glycosyltransferase involved in cell wall biosynthesis